MYNLNSSVNATSPSYDENESNNLGVKRFGLYNFPRVIIWSQLQFFRKNFNIRWFFPRPKCTKNEHLQKVSNVFDNIAISFVGSLL